MVRNACSKLLVALLLSTSSVTVYAQTAYQKGWDSFLNNKREDARNHFKKAIKDDKTKSEAYLSLSILDNAEGRTEQAFDNWSKFYDGTEKANVFFYSSSMMPFTYSVRNALKQNKLDFLQTLESSQSLDGYTREVVTTNLGYHYFGVNETEKAKEYFASTGAMNDWQVLGRFDNTSGGGFNKDWGAVDKAKATDKFINSVGAEVTWFYPGENKIDRWFYHDYYMQSANSIVYAQTFVTSPEVQDVILSIGVSGSLKAWVNDKLVLSVEDERNCGSDLYAAKVKLNKGANRILLQLGASEVNSSNFYARFVDENGSAVSGLSHNHVYADYQKDLSKDKVVMLDFYPEKYLKKYISENKNNLLYEILLVEQYLNADKTDEGTELLLSLQKRYPNSSYIHQRLSECYFRAKNQTFATREIESILTSDPDSFYGLNMLISLAQESDKVNEVKKLLEKVVDLYGKSDYSVGIEQWLAIREKDSQKRVSLAQELYKKHPEDYPKMSNLYQITENTLKDPKAAKQIVEEYYNKYHNENAIQTLSSIYMKEGETEKALELLEERLNKLPYTSGYYLSYAQTLLSMQRYDKALEIMARLQKQTPFEATTYNQLATIYKEKGDKKLATENYRKTLYYYPGYFSALQQLRLLDEEEELEFYFPKNNLDSLIAKAGSSSDYPEDHSLILLLTEDVLYHEGGANESRVELAVKILNQAGIDAWKEYSLGAFSGQNITLDKSEIIKANGQKVRAEANGGHIVFTGLEIGDVLHVDYRVSTYYSGKLAQMINGGRLFQYMLPTMQTRYMMATPHDFKFDYKFENSDLKPVISKLKNKTLYRWELNNQSSVKEEPLMPNLQEVVPTLFYSNYPDWKYVREWYEDLTTNKFKADYLVKSTVAQILAGKETAPDLEKAKLFYEYILKNTSYLNVAFMQDNHIPQSASRTLSTHLGDCKDVSTLFVAMCREVGIDANVVLVLTRDNAANSLLLPSNTFNHAVAELNVDGKRYILELTSNQLPFGAMFENLADSKILSIKKPASGKTDMLEDARTPDQPINKVVRQKKIEFDGNNFKIDYESRNYESRAAYLRHSYANVGVEEQKKSLNEAAASDFRTKTTVSDLEFKNLENLENYVEYKYKLAAENTVQDIAGMKVFKLVWTDNLGSLEELAIENRKFPFLSWSYIGADLSQETITLTIPEGMKLIEIPEDVNFECANAKYSLKFDTSTSGVFKVTREFAPKAGVVSLNDYAEYCTFMRNVSLSDEKQYVIK